MAHEARKAGARHANMVLATDAPPLDTSKLRYDYGQVSEDHRQEVMEAAVDILANGNRAKHSIVAMGQRLIEVKALLPEGKFTAWITTEFELSDRMAQNFMNVARQYGERPEIISVLNDTVLYLLAAPSTPDPVRQAVEARAIQTGRSPKVAEVKAIRDVRKPPPTPPPAKEVYLRPEPKEIPLGPPLAKPVEATDTPPTMPAELVEAGYTLVKVSKNSWRWEINKVWGGFRSEHYASAGDAVKDAYKDFDRHQVALQSAPVVPIPEEPPLTDTAPTMPDDLAAAGYELVATGLMWMWTLNKKWTGSTHYDPNNVIAEARDYEAHRPKAASPDARIAEAYRLRSIYQEAVDAIPSYEQLLGKDGKTHPSLSRWLNGILSDLETLIISLSPGGANEG